MLLIFTQVLFSNGCLHREKCIDSILNYGVDFFLDIYLLYKYQARIQSKDLRGGADNFTRLLIKIYT